MSNEHPSLAEGLTGLIKDSVTGSAEAKAALDANTKSVDGLTLKIEGLKTSIDELVSVRSLEVKIQEDESAKLITLREEEVEAIKEQSKGRWRVWDTLKPAIVPAVAVLAMAVVGGISSAITYYFNNMDGPPAIAAPIVQEVPSVQ